VIDASYLAERFDGQPTAGPTRQPPPTFREASLGRPAPSYKATSEPVATVQKTKFVNHSLRYGPSNESSCYSNNFDGAYPSVEASTSSTNVDDAEIIDLVSSDDHSPQSALERARTAETKPAPARLKLKLTVKEPRLWHQACFSSSLDSQGSPYPSPYSSTDSSNNILAYHAAKAKKGTTLRPTLRAGHADRYTSVLEHDLATTKTRLAQANCRLKILKSIKKVNEALKVENETLKQRLCRLMAGQDEERAGEDFNHIAERASTDPTSIYFR